VRHAHAHGFAAPAANTSAYERAETSSHSGRLGRLAALYVHLPGAVSDDAASKAYGFNPPLSSSFTGSHSSK